MVIVFKIDRDRLSQQMFDRAKVFLFLSATERNCSAVRSRASRSPDAMDVGFRFNGKIVVDYVGNVVDVETSGGDVGCYKYSVITVLEPVERLGSGRLAFVAVNGCTSNAHCVQFLHHPVGDVFHLGENYRLFDAGIFQQISQKVIFFLLVNV